MSSLRAGQTPKQPPSELRIPWHKVLRTGMNPSSLRAGQTPWITTLRTADPLAQAPSGGPFDEQAKAAVTLLSCTLVKTGELTEGSA